MIIKNIEKIPEEERPIFEPRNFYYDIEVLAQNINVFPTSDCCPIIQIGYFCTIGTSKVIESGVLCLGKTEGYESFDDELQLLYAFMQKVLRFDPDVFVSFNGDAFDMP